MAFLAVSCFIWVLPCFALVLSCFALVPADLIYPVLTALAL